MTLQDKTICSSPSNEQTRIAGLIIKELERVSNGWSKREVFRDWLGLCEHTLKMLPFHFIAAATTGQMAEDTDEVKAYWAEMRRKYQPKDFEHFKTAFQLLQDSAGIAYMDVLGAIFMLWGVASDPAGQYFTPWDICVLMARLQTAGDDLSEKGLARYTVDSPMKVMDPTCGSGTMLLAFASLLPDAFVRGGRVMFYGQDNDPTCCQMARVNERLYGLNRTGIWVPDEMSAEVEARPDTPGTTAAAGDGQADGLSAWDVDVILMRPAQPKAAR